MKDIEHIYDSPRQGGGQQSMVLGCAGFLGALLIAAVVLFAVTAGGSFGTALGGGTSCNGVSVASCNTSTATVHGDGVAVAVSGQDNNTETTTQFQPPIGGEIDHAADRLSTFENALLLVLMLVVCLGGSAFFLGGGQW